MYFSVGAVPTWAVNSGGWGGDQYAKERQGKVSTGGSGGPTLEICLAHLV